MGVIVVGYVPRPEGEAALRQAVEEARLRDASLVVVNSHRGGREYGDADAVDTEEQLDTLRERLTDAGVEHEVRELVRGADAAEDLVTVADEVGADLMIIGLRRRSPIGKLVLGSNAQRVLLDATCPVLAVKAAE